MTEKTIDEITERLNRALTMTPTSRATTSSALPGLNEVQKEQIKQMIESTVRSGIDNAMDEGTDQPIGTITDNLNELDRVPDIVRSIRDFSGTPGEFNSWRKSVDRVLEVFNSLRGTARYYAILHVIRTKITGDADTALESYRTPLDWGKIKRCLMMHYSDKRDIGTLEYQMTVLCQGNRSINEFYQAVYQHLSLILDKVSCLDLDEASLRAMTNTYREKALDTFIRGLSGDLPRLLSIREPTSLPQALHICLKLDNMNFRRNYAQGQNSRSMIQKDKIGSFNFTQNRKFYPELAYTGAIGPVRPPIPPRMNCNPIIPQISHNINRFQRQLFRPQYPVNFNGHYKAHNAEPMEVDQSAQTRQANYMNRPTMYQNPKRSAPGSFQGPVSKMQRNFHLNTGFETEDPWYDPTYLPEGVELDAPLIGGGPDYLQDYLQQVPDEQDMAPLGEEDHTDVIEPVVNFLD